MKFDINDPKLTAYALGELNSEDSKLVEELLRENARAKAFVEEIKATALLLQGELASEPTPSLTESQSKTLQSKFAGSWISSLRIKFNWTWFIGLAPAFALILIVINLRVNPPALVTNQTPEVVARQEIKLEAPPTSENTSAVPSDSKRPSRDKEFALGAAKTPSIAKNDFDSLSTEDSSSGEPNSMDLTEEKSVPTEQLQAEFSMATAKQEVAMQHSMPGKALAAKKGSSLDLPGGRASVLSYGGSVSGAAPSSGGFISQTKELRLAQPKAKLQKVVKEGAEGANSEQYAQFSESPFLKVSDQPLSTFSVDVDTASYSNLRRFINNGSLPPKDSVRIEEMINYFSYNYKDPIEGKPFSINLEMASAPWDANHQLVRIGLRGQSLQQKERPATNLVFLIDVSGSMEDANKLPLLRESMKLLIKQMTSKDVVSIVVYAGSSGIVLSPTKGNEHEKIIAAFNSLTASGSTNGAQGIEAAYRLATENFIRGGVNRVILATDGDFNVGVSSEGDLIRLIQDKAKSGVFLSVLGFGMGNLKDSMMVKLADKGNGHYAYIDNLKEARKVLVDELGGTLVTIAKDVKVQVEFNPKYISSYRLVGYEKRALLNEDFNNDAIDAGEIGAGHTVTAFYEVISAAKDTSKSKVDSLKYQTKPTVSGDSSEALTVKLRFKKPDGDISQLIEVPLKYEEHPFVESSSDFQFASAVASFGLLLRDSDYKATTSFEGIAALAEKNLFVNGNKNPLRSEFVDLVRSAGKIKLGK